MTDQKNGDSWGYESPDEEDIEVCFRSIDLWGILFIDYYIVACQAFFSFFYFSRFAFAIRVPNSNSTAGYLTIDIVGQHGNAAKRKNTALRF